MTQRILLVDDEPHILDSLKLTLRNHLVDTEANVGKALQKLQERDYAVVISDMRMPGIDGLEFLRAAALIAPTTIRLMLTGHGDLEVAKSAINACGVFKFMTKPINADEMRDIVADALREHERLTADATLLEAALHDGLTGLPNRTLFLDRFEMAAARAKRNQTSMAVLFLDLDGFKGVNDTFGHDAGDKVLETIAKRLRDRIRVNDTVARFGGDEFVILLCDLENPEAAVDVAESLIPIMSAPIEWKDGELQVGGSIGVSYYPQDGNTVEEALRKADAAMYQAKRGDHKVILANSNPAE